MAHWFDEQLRQRMQNDQDHFERAFFDLSSVVMGDRFGEGMKDRRRQVSNAVDEILRFFRIELTEVPESVDDLAEYMDDALRPTGVMKRRVRLTGRWYRDAIGPMITTLTDGQVVALLPRAFGGYTFIDPDSGHSVVVNRRTVSRLNDDAYCFYKPFPLHSLNIRSLLSYMVSVLRPGDAIAFVGVSLLVTLMGLLTPAANELIFGEIIPAGNAAYLVPTLVLLCSIAVASTMLGVAKSFLSQRLTTRIELAVEPATMSRVLMLPATFFREYNSGELSSRMAALSQLCNSLVDAITGTLLSAILSLIYLFQINSITPALVAPALLTVLALAVLNTLTAWLELRQTRLSMDLDAKMSGLVFALFSGIRKIKQAGAEKRCFSKWAQLYKRSAQLRYMPPALITYASVVNTVITSLGLLAFYVIAIQQHVSAGQYMAFSSSYGMISSALLSLAGLTTTFAEVKPQLEMVEPILKAVPENSGTKTIVENLSGAIELSRVSFRYDPDGADILNDISLTIKPHEYIAIVGKTGCGKSTLMRMLLGFETPRKGAVYFDHMDVSKLDLRSLRRRIGVVTQNGKLFSGDIFSNIAISAPDLTMDEAWEVAKMSGLDQDINDMPMGMYTVLTEGTGGLSGGQRQRLMIARALASKPRILLLDEATSALDNITQKQVADSLASLKCTRVVIAHRLSTIRECDRILVLDHGTIAESGTFDELLAKKGLFYDLASRQLLESTGDVAATNVY